MWQLMLLKLGINLVSSYIKSSDSKQDDKILDIVKDGASYLADKDNNDVTYRLADSIFNSSMKDKEDR